MCVKGLLFPITGLFVDIGNNYSVLAHPNICFVYDYVGSKDEEKSQGDFVSHRSYTLSLPILLHIVARKWKP